MRLSTEQARRRFTRARVARLATVAVDGAPHLVPVTFALLTSAEHPDTVVFAIDHKPKSTLRLQRLRNIARNPSVSLLVDHYADDWSDLWWVRADGRAAELADASVRAAAVAALVAKYPQYAERPPAGPAVEIRVRRWTGWSAGPPTEA